MATIKDVARLAGVSVATVSRVINNSPKASEASRQSVGAAMETLNYHPNANARALAQQSTETVGLVVGDVSAPSSARWSKPSNRWPTAPATFC